MLPKSILAALAWSVASGSLALAAPIEQDTPEWTSLLTSPAEASPFNEAAVEKRADAPDYCQSVSTDIYGGGPSSRYQDITPECSRNGRCDWGCLVVRYGGIGDDLTISDIADLKNAIAQQSHKRGTFDTTDVGRWLVTYDLFYGKDEFPSEMLQHWFHLLDGFALKSLKGSWDLRDIAFEWGMGDKRNFMVAQKD